MDVRLYVGSLASAVETVRALRVPFQSEMFVSRDSNVDGQSGSRGTLGLLNMGVGTASVALGLVRVFNNAQTETQSRLRFVPWLGMRASPGLAASAAF